MKAASSHPFLIIAAACSLAAGMIHAGAAGSHAELNTLATLYALVGMLQVVWAVAALTRGGRKLILAGVVLQTLALGAWVTSRTAGISFIPGLEDKLSIGFQDGTVAALQSIAIVTALVAVGVKVTGKVWRPIAPAIGALALIAAVPAAASEHDHGSHAHDDTEIAHDADDGHHDDAGGDDHDAADGHHDDDDAESPDHAGMTVAEHEAMTSSSRAGKTTAELGYPSQFAAWFDDASVDLDDAADAEQLLIATNEAMKAFPDEAAVQAAGYISIGDGVTGWEHYINLAHIGTAETLNPDAIESIVLRVNPDGTKDVATAMYLMSTGGMDDVPPLGGELTIWHDHQNLCWVGVQVVGTTDRTGKCENGTFRGTAPMMHVWSIEHPCGPFAGIEGSHGEGCSHGDHGADEGAAAAAGGKPVVPDGHDNSDGHHD